MNAKIDLRRESWARIQKESYIKTRQGGEVVAALEFPKEEEQEQELNKNKWKGGAVNERIKVFFFSFPPLDGKSIYILILYDR